MPEQACRCAWDGQGEHPCHFDGYRCRKPSVRRLYAQQTPYSIAGMQPKVVACETWSCDEHWALFSAELAKAVGR